MMYSPVFLRKQEPRAKSCVAGDPGLLLPQEHIDA
jgi:hypothetical protein